MMQQDKPKMDDEEEKRARGTGGGTIDIDVIDLAARRASASPQWREVEGDWEMSVDGKLVAALAPSSDAQFPQYKLLSDIVSPDYPITDGAMLILRRLKQGNTHSNNGSNMPAMAKPTSQTRRRN